LAYLILFIGMELLNVEICDVSERGVNGFCSRLAPNKFCRFQAINEVAARLNTPILSGQKRAYVELVEDEYRSVSVDSLMRALPEHENMCLFYAVLNSIGVDMEVCKSKGCFTYEHYNEFCSGIYSRVGKHTVSENGTTIAQLGKYLKMLHQGSLIKSFTFKRRHIELHHLFRPKYSMVGKRFVLTGATVSPCVRQDLERRVAKIGWENAFEQAVAIKNFQLKGKVDVDWQPHAICVKYTEENKAGIIYDSAKKIAKPLMAENLVGSLVKVWHVYELDIEW
jgi:hypothetical protein